MKKLAFVLAASLVVSSLGAGAAFAAETTETATEAVVEETTTVLTTSADGLISIELPDATWQQVTDVLNNEVFSDGNSVIRFNVYKVGDSTIPNRAVTDDTHKIVCEDYVMGKDYIYIATACIHEEEDYEAVNAALDSITVDVSKITEDMTNHDSKKAYTVKDASYDVWVNTDVLNVRAGYSTDSDLIGAVKYGTKLQVTGIVYDGEGTEAGWVRINYNGVVAYVGAGFITTTEISTQPETQPETEPETESSEYIGYTFGGTDPWGGALSVTLRSVSDGTLYWTFTDIIDDSHMIYRELESSYANGYCEWYIEGTIGDNYDMNYNYAGNIKLQGGYVELTFTSGECVELSEEGDSTSHSVGAAIDAGTNTVALNKQY